jgi:hypothetical protein
MKLTFNTKRLYTAEGQVITAIHDPEANKVHFSDWSRMCNGTIDGPLLGRFNTQREFAEFVMRKYDRNQYQNTREAYEMLMMNRRPDTEPVVIQL